MNENVKACLFVFCKYKKSKTEILQYLIQYLVVAPLAAIAASSVL